jgi:rod shape-determining protein MreD
MNELEGAFEIGSRSRNKASQVRPWVMVATPLGAILFQVYLPLYVPLLSYVELPLLVTIYLAMSRRSPAAGALVGTAIGLVQDALSHLPIGILGMTKTLVGYLSASIGLRLETGNAIVRFLLGTVLFLSHQFLYGAFRRGLLGTPVGYDVFPMLVAAPVNGLIGVVLFHLLDKLTDSEE